MTTWYHDGYWDTKTITCIGLDGEDGLCGRSGVRLPLDEEFDSIWEAILQANEEAREYDSAGGICDECKKKIARHLNVPEDKLYTIARRQGIPPGGMR